MYKRKKVYNFPIAGNIDVKEFNDIYINEISDEIYRHDLEPYPNYEYVDENYYDKVINSDHLKFSKDEITCIHKLLGNEILDDTLNNIKNYAVSNPIKQTENINECKGNEKLWT